MIVIANDCNNSAVWGALKLHIKFLKSCNKDVTLLVPNRYYKYIEDENLECKVVKYKSTLDEVLKLAKLEDKEIFVPDMMGGLFSILAKLKGKKIYYWMQGAVPEESFMRNSSKLRLNVLSFIEKVALKLSDGYIFVSSYMKDYIEQKHKSKFEPSIIVPCVSDIKYNGAKKEKDSFVYIGGMSVWQRVDKMLLLFKEIKEVKRDAKFYIATKEQQKAKELIEKYIPKEMQSSIILTSFSKRDEIEQFLSTKEYGFLIRDDSVVNYVSSPIKLAEYLACGVNVIISNSVKSYAPLVEEYNAGVVVDSKNNTIDISKLNANISNAKKLYSDIFSAHNHIKSYNMLLERL